MGFSIIITEEVREALRKFFQFLMGFSHRQPPPGAKSEYAFQFLMGFSGGRR